MTGVTVCIPPHYWWEPKEDITAYELALCMPMIAAASGGGWMHIGSLYCQLPAGSQRHWRVEEQK